MRPFPREEDDRAGDDTRPRDGGRFDGGEGDDRERRTNVLDEAGADDVELRGDPVREGGARRAPGSVGMLGAWGHWAGAKVRAAEFMQ